MPSVDTAAQKLAWLSLKPVTGRTHQLRAHAAHIGHPIVGDPKYFDIENWELPGGIQNKLHLLARRIVIAHPRTGKPIDITAPLPPHMQQSFNLLGFDTAATTPSSRRRKTEFRLPPSVALPVALSPRTRASIGDAPVDAFGRRALARRRSMEHKPLDQLRSVADVQPRPLTREERLQRWIDLLEADPTRRLNSLGEIEYKPPAERAWSARTIRR